MSEVAWTSSELRDVAAEIAVLRNINGGHLPSSIDQFWHELVLDAGLTVGADLLDRVSAVAASYGIDPDEDYIDRTNGLPTLSMYEAILATLQVPDVGSGVPSPDLDDDGDDTDVDLSKFIADVPPQPWTVRETILRIGEGSLVLNPEWQRGFVWKLQKQRRLIESMLLGLPIPSFLFFEESSTGQIFVIDGRQRLETIWRFVSEKEAKGQPKLRFRTLNAKTPGWGPGQALNGAANKYHSDLPEHLKKRFDRAPLVTFTFKDIPSEQLYQIFKRYNTGAVALNAAEIRNAVYQASPLHAMMFKLGGEHRDPSKYTDNDEMFVAETLRQTIPKGKLERYGAYDFIGRYFAFRYQSTGSVAAATNAFMQRFSSQPDKVEAFRQEFIRAVTQTLTWYEFPLVEPAVDGTFNAMLATIQLVSTSEALALIDAGELTSDIVQDRVQSEWSAFAGKILQEGRYW